MSIQPGGGAPARRNRQELLTDKTAERLDEGGDRTRRRNPTSGTAGEAHGLQVKRGAGNRQPALWKDDQADEGSKTQDHAASFGERRRGESMIAMHGLTMLRANEGQRQHGEDDSCDHDRTLN